MARNERARPYDIVTQAITRPDIVPSALRDDDSVTYPTVERELSPYPRLPELPPPRFEEATVADPALQRARHVPDPVSVEAPGGDTTAVPRSGPRHRQVSSVPPPPPLPHEIERAETEEALRQLSQNRRSTTRRRTQPAPPETPRPRTGQLLLFAALTVIVGASFGASLGNGSLPRAIQNLSKQEPTPGLLASIPARPPRTAEPKTTPASSVVHFQDLPSEPKSEEPEQTVKDLKRPAPKKVGARRR